MKISRNILSLRRLILIALVAMASVAKAQVGEYRSNFAVGFNGGYMLSNLGFVPRVSQSMLGGLTGGITARYISEKYFSTICSVQGELNWAQAGWKEKIRDKHEQPCVNNVTGLPEEYSRTLTYVQMPFFAHLAWGKEKKGAQFFFQAGPQVGMLISESTKTNFAYEDALNTTPNRTNTIIAQDSMAVERKFDYGIAAGLGMELSIPNAGHLMLEARYYYGLGNIYGDSKRDYFAKSNISSIIVKLAWLFDL